MIGDRKLNLVGSDLFSDDEFEQERAAAAASGHSLVDQKSKRSNKTQVNQLGLSNLLDELALDSSSSKNVDDEDGVAMEFDKTPLKASQSNMGTDFKNVKIAADTRGSKRQARNFPPGIEASSSSEDPSSFLSSTPSSGGEGS